MSHDMNIQEEAFRQGEISAISKAVKNRDDARLGRALKWASDSGLYIPLVGFIRKQTINFLLYQYNHRKDG